MEIRVSIAKVAEQLDISYEEVIIEMAVHLGDLENRHLAISELADTTGLKFSSTHRYLQNLRNRGHILSRQEGKRQVHFFPGKAENVALTKAYSEIDRAVRRACRALADTESAICK